MLPLNLVAALPEMGGSKIATYHFNSDNGAPVCEQVMNALVNCNRGVEVAYGADQFTATLAEAYSNFFERETFIFPVPTGTAGNGLALGAITPPYGTIFCHERAHIVTTEAGAPEFYSGGGRMTLLPGEHHKISPAALECGLQSHGIGNVHHMAVSALSITQATEAGVVYEMDELRALSAIAHNAGMKVHLDGARLANAMVHLGATPAEMTWKAGVDVLTFGTIKNGTMNAEAVITFDPEIAKILSFMHKRAGHLCSKMRYMSVQLLSYLEDELWRRNALQANGNAARIADALRLCAGVELVHPVHINEVFAILPPSLLQALRDKDIHLRPWNFQRKGQGFRMVMSYCDSTEQIQRFEQACRERGPSKA
ncbi:beta-eliminating lyase-related protein [Mesorhizobium sp. NZP2077]|uniref:threonine aldolase family protein n=1 Tax=Mesorhizobium sp. NZP2077 TaxID=2483404 RepID=UPI001556A33C|nr:beta-eliminating lyase-related protein [Mesorhizobium sp. NZP2077]QKD20427.1 low specificity L-threonine aldolase [Mesorhizobium sp. NZP2077]